MTRLAVITGGAGMLGGAVASALAAAEVDTTVLVDIAQERLHAAAERLRASGRDAVAVPCDVADAHSVVEAAQAVSALGGTPSILVNAMGVPGRRGARDAAEDVSDADWDHTLRVNLTGAFLWCRAVIPSMKRQKYGRIVNIASLAGRTASSTAALPYTVSKAGLLGLTRALAAELAPHGILVNAVAPGRIENGNWPSPGPASPDLPPIGRLAVADEVATAVAFLASVRNSYMCGATLDVNGGRFIA